jgi:hypothetical protein
MSNKQMKPLDAYSKLSERKRRLINKLILSLHDNTISDESDEFHAIKRIVNRARRGLDTTVGGRYNNGYLEFYREQYGDFREDHKDMKVTNIAREMGKQWKALTSEQQQVYKDRVKQKKTSK